MKNIKNGYEKWLYIVPFLLVWLLLIQLSGIANLISSETIKEVPNAVMYSGIFYFIFSKYVWKWKFLQGWVVPYPNLQGTWHGILKSTWKNPETGKVSDPIPTQFCIRQDFENVYITIFTKESQSNSQVARFLIDNDGTLGLIYTYSNKPNATVRERSAIHDGAAFLKISMSSSPSLNGEYFTSRKTTGEIKIKRTSSKLVDCYNEQ